KRLDLRIVVGIDLGHLNFRKLSVDGNRHVAGEDGFEIFDDEIANSEAADERFVSVGAELDLRLEAARFVEVAEVIDLGAGDGAGHSEGDGLIGITAGTAEREETTGEGLGDIGAGSDGLGLAGFFEDGEFGDVDSLVHSRASGGSTGLKPPSQRRLVKAQGAGV